MEGSLKMTVFDLYSAYYDLLYGDKNYAAETDYIVSLIGSDPLRRCERILELGSGTGGHAYELASRGFLVFGVDLSERMVEIAAARSLKLQAVPNSPEFAVGDIRSFRLGATFDVVLSLFHVMSYQVTNRDVHAAMATARAHLRSGGLFVFDCWYGGAVLSDRPKATSKSVSNDRIEVFRRTLPTMHVAKNCVDVQFDVEIVSREDGVRQLVTENHWMRYFFVPEITSMLEAEGFRLNHAYAWMTREPVDDKSWYACFIAEAV